ncbi:MAG: ribose 5-phosphate isomerase B [Ruminococcaceae bacterium]|nr:ribose 5-phosphate isomerase B [Oscillospiraceae bacterium]
MIAFGCDHNGVELKNAVMNYLREKGIECTDVGAYENASYDDYPVYAKKVADLVSSGEAEKGFLFCGTGLGMMLCANKKPGVRAVCSIDSYSVKYSRLHNNANVLCMGANVISKGLALELADIFMSTGFMGERHERRVKMLEEIYKD